MAAAAIIALSAAFVGCHRAKSPMATAADVASAQADAQKEVSDAHLEAKKDVKNAAKLAGGDSKNVAVARATGTFDIAMANADGAHKVAIEQCLTLVQDAQQACKDRADADYSAAIANAKAMRITRLQKTI
jgi:acetylornithine deacetylase/succinyl-diaminopimelate desuccinylase-like protein